MAKMRVQLLDEQEVKRLEASAYRLLAEVGVSVEHARATELLRGLGCRVDKGRVFMPGAVVEKALASLDKRARFCSADGAKEVSLDGRTVRAHNGGGMANILDGATGKRRRATLKDVSDAARLLDALPNVDVVLPMFGPQDVPAAVMIPESFAALLRNTRKPIAAAAAESAADVRYMVAMAEACCGGHDAFVKRPTLSIMVSPISPLRLPPKVAEAIMAVAEAGAQFQALPCPMLGTTSPITIAGGVAQQYAEILASFVLAAAVRPGLRVLSSNRISAIDLHTAGSTWSGPEIAMAAAAAVQLAHHGGFACDTYGFCSTSAKLDPQVAYERFPSAAMPALAGADILSGAGVLENAATGSLALLVIDDELLGYIRHLAGGVEVTADTLAFDLSREVISEGGIFLDREQTVEQLGRGCCWMPKIGERQTGEAADSNGAGVLARAMAKQMEILGGHRLEPLPADVDKALDEIMAEARRELCASAKRG